MDRDNILYNTFTCMGFSEELQASMNELIKYVIDTYIDYAVKGNELDSSDLKEDNVNDIAKKYFCYAFELMFSGVFPDTYQILMQSYYESKMASLVGADNLDAIRIRGGRNPFRAMKFLGAELDRGITCLVGMDRHV